MKIMQKIKVHGRACQHCDMKELSARKNVHICAQHVCFKRARFQVSYRFIRLITCNLRGSPYRRNLGVIIFNGRHI